ncbi:MAG: hypothetical protein ACRDWY_16150 [Actinomycetes bacterium]
MFLTDCQACGQRELRGARAIDLLVNTDQGIDVVYSCTRCGQRNLLDATRGTAARVAA